MSNMSAFQYLKKHIYFLSRKLLRSFPNNAHPSSPYHQNTLSSPYSPLLYPMQAWSASISRPVYLYRQWEWCAVSADGAASDD